MYEADFLQLRSILDNLVRLFGEIREQHDPPQPNQGSQADQEIGEQAGFATLDGFTPVENCYKIAELRLFVARDYIESVSRLLRTPHSFTAPQLSYGFCLSVLPELGGLSIRQWKFGAGWPAG